MAIVPYKNSLQRPARELRKNMTPWERKLWYEFLREQKPRFLRQKPIGDYMWTFTVPRFVWPWNWTAASILNPKGRRMTPEEPEIWSGWV